MWSAADGCGGQSVEAGCKTYHLKCQTSRPFSEDKLGAKKAGAAVENKKRKHASQDVMLLPLNSSPMLTRSRSRVSS